VSKGYKNVYISRLDRRSSNSASLLFDIISRLYQYVSDFGWVFISIVSSARDYNPAESMDELVYSI
jgi:hypothetical protein